MSRYTKTMREALQEVSSYEIPTTQDLELITEEIPAELPPGGPDVPRYKNVSNATVDKADKKANKEKKKVEKEVLDPKLDEENLDEFDLPPSTVSDKDLGDKINREHEKEKKRRAAIDAKKIAAGKKLPYKKEENLLDSAKRYLNEKADWNTAFKSAAQSRPPMKYKDAVSFIDTAGLNSTEKRSALKAAKKWLR